MKTFNLYPEQSLRTRCGHRHGERGFTLIELITVMAVMAVLIGVGLPSFRSMVVNMRIKNASFDIYSSLLAARNEAMTRNTTVTITPSGGTNWASGWTTTAGTTTVKTQDAFPDTTITGPATLVYNSSGRVTTAANCPTSSPTKVCVMVATKAAPTVPVRCVTIDLSGRPATSLPASGECQ